MTKIAEGYAEVASTAIHFDESDVGDEYIPFESADDCLAIATAIIENGYGRAYGLTVDAICVDFEPSNFGDEYKGAVPSAVSAKLLADGGVNVDSMWDFDAVLISE